MAKAITKTQLIAKLAKSCELKKKQVAGVLDCIVRIAYKEAKNGFTFPGLGKLVIVNRKARMGRNPATAAPIKIPAKRVLKFRIAMVAKKSILRAKSGNGGTGW
ncbi:MAG: HU family DNA-binding protein [Acidobacteriota bacterium]